jgi:hypothetical protein
MHKRFASASIPSNDPSTRNVERFRRAALFAIVLGLASGAAIAAGPDDRIAAEQTLKHVEASPHKDVAKELVARARAAQARAAKLRTEGDEPHARLADALARSWAEAAQGTLRAVIVEEKAHAARRDATDAGAAAERERALLEEAAAQGGRLRAQLEAAAREGKDQPARTSAAATGDAGAPQKTAPRPKAPAADAGAK